MGHDISISEAREMYINYYYKNNTKRVDDETIRFIESRYANDIKGWSAAYESKDSTKYDISDSDEANNAKEKGGKDIRKAGDYHGDEKKERAKNLSTSTTLSATGAAFSGADAGIVFGAKTTTKCIDGIEFTTGGATKAANSAAGKACFVIGCTLALATGVAYEIMRPNKKEVEALVKMGLYMQDTTQAEMAASQEEMEQIQSEIEEQVEIAEASNEALREGIETEVSKNDVTKTQLETYNSKISSGEGLTQEEAANYKILAESQKSTTENITGMEDSAQEELTGIYDGIGELQSGYDDVALNLENSIGQVEEAASMDKVVKTSCQVETAMQALNVAGGSISAAQAFAFAPLSFGWSLAFGIMALGGVAMSVHGMAEQIGFIKKIDTEIGQRNDLADTNQETSEMYDEHLGEFDASLGYVDNIVHEAPTDLEVVELAEEVEPVVAQEPAANQTASSAPNANPFGSVTNNQSGGNPFLRKTPEQTA